MEPSDEQVIPALYLAEAATWAHDVHGALRRSRDRALWVAGIALFIAVLEGVALVLLLPLKTVVPYTIMVDRHTGVAEPARSLAPGPMSENEALVQSALAQYVIARETVDAADIAANYRKVGLWSTGSARRDYLLAMDRANPASILNNATAATLITTGIRSITLLDKGNALVRFSTDRRDGDGPVTRTEWVAVIRFGFAAGPMSAQDRLLNPLGFQVSHYRRDAESPVATVAAVPATAVPRAPEMPK